MSWEPPASQPQRSLSCDTTASDPMAMNFTLGGGIGAHLVDDQHQSGLPSNGAPASGAPAAAAAGISSSSSEHDNHETGTWSSDYSNSEDECSQIGSGGADNAILVSLVRTPHAHVYTSHICFHIICLVDTNGFIY